MTQFSLINHYPNGGKNHEIEICINMLINAFFPKWLEAKSHSLVSIILGAGKF